MNDGTTGSETGRVRTIGVITVGRSDYGLYRPILRVIHRDPQLRLHLIVAGMHLVPEFGNTVRDIERDGFPIAERVEMLLASDDPGGAAKAMGVGMLGFAQAYARERPDILLVLGDRFEMFAAALAALPYAIPVAHIHGGELTLGAFDDALRHALTKLSHLHFLANEEYARRVRQMGEEPWRVLVSGSPAVDNLQAVRLLNREELLSRYGLHLDRAPLLVTYHPETLEQAQLQAHVEELLAALERLRVSVVFTAPNADPGGRWIHRRLESFVAANPWAQLVDHLGTDGYYSVMALAAAMVGNSSSGLVEAPSFRLPVVNVGRRQEGRVRAHNVIDVSSDRREIAEAIQTAMSPEFRAGLERVVNPYGDGHAADRIVGTLKTVKLDALIVKRFVDLSLTGGSVRA